MINILVWVERDDQYFSLGWKRGNLEIEEGGEGKRILLKFNNHKWGMNISFKKIYILSLVKSNTHIFLFFCHFSMMMIL